MASSSFLFLGSGQLGHTGPSGTVQLARHALGKSITDLALPGLPVYAKTTGCQPLVVEKTRSLSGESFLSSMVVVTSAGEIGVTPGMGSLGCVAGEGGGTVGAVAVGCPGTSGAAGGGVSWVWPGGGEGGACVELPPHEAHTRETMANANRRSIIRRAYRTEWGLFHRHGLGEISRLIDIGSLEIGHVIRKKLEGKDREDRLQLRRRVGDEEDVVGERADLVVPAAGDGDDLALARLHLRQVRDHLFVDRARRREDHDRQARVDEGDGAVLHLARGVALGVNVANLLQLERALEGDGVLVAAPEEEEALGRQAIAARQDVQLRPLVDDVLHLIGQMQETVDQLGGRLLAEGAV